MNRVWQYHFGQGIVNTPSDFGLNGDRPSHPELLDWLAVSFMENGWSLRWLHRQILLSAAYRQSDAFNSGSTLRSNTLHTTPCATTRTRPPA